MIVANYENQYISYMLRDNAAFSQTAYRVLNRQEDAGLIPCRRITVNGRYKLYYPVGEYRLAADVVRESSFPEMCALLRQILEVLIRIEKNGFLRLDMADLSKERVFVTRDGEAALILLPLREEEIPVPGNRNLPALHLLGELSAMYQGMDTRGPAELAQVLRERYASLEELSRMLSHLAAETRTKEAGTPAPAEAAPMGAVPMGAASRGAAPMGAVPMGAAPRGAAPMGAAPMAAASMERKLYFLSRDDMNTRVLINKPEFVLGKSRAADGIVYGGPVISRRHCMLHVERDSVYIEDLNSMNHTYVNGRMVLPGERVKIRPGDVISLANVNFGIEYR